MAITLIRNWPNGLAPGDAYTLAALAPVIQSSPGVGTAGNVVWVDSTTTDAINDGSFQHPVKTLAAAHALAGVVADQGAIVVIMENHAEVVSSTVTLSKAGVTYLGLGAGGTRPRFTNACGATPMFTISGKSSFLCNLQFPASTSTGAGSYRCNVTADGCAFVNCDFWCGTLDTTVGNGIYATKDYINVTGCSFTASGTVAAQPAAPLVFNKASQIGVVVGTSTFTAGAAGWSSGNGIEVNAAALSMRMTALVMSGASRIKCVTGTTGFITGTTSSGGPLGVDWTV